MKYVIKDIIIYINYKNIYNYINDDMVKMLDECL